MPDKEFLEKLKDYIEEVEEQIEGEWGDGKTAQQLIDQRKMPEVYWEVVRRLG